MGTPEKPLTNDVEVILYGKKTDKQFMHFGNKVISLKNSRIDIHGAPRKEWTYIKTSLEVGDTTFEVSETVDWV
jgi:hypothetical protein